MDGEDIIGVYKNQIPVWYLRATHIITVSWVKFVLVWLVDFLILFILGAFRFGYLLSTFDERDGITIKLCVGLYSLTHFMPTPT